MKISRRDAVREAAIQIVDRMLALREASSLSVPENATGKDQRASEALRELQALGKLLAGWAIAHRMGLSLNGLSRLPRLHPKIRGEIASMQAQAMVDDHRHERRGLEPDADLALSLNGKALRRHMIDHFMRAPGVSTAVGERMRAGLMSLSFGKVENVFRAGRAQRAVDFQMRALEMVAFRRGMNMTREAAIESVSDAFAIAHETVEKWEQRLSRVLGEVEFKSRLAFARSAGETAWRIRNDPKEGAWRGELEAEFGDVALVDLARRYRAVSKKRKAPVRRQNPPKG